jgi:Phosphate-induced protein 1 conserved region
MKHGIFLAIFIALQVIVTEAMPCLHPNYQLRNISNTVSTDDSLMDITYHHGSLMKSPIKVYYLWYGNFSTSTMNIVKNFTKGLNSSSWWKINRDYGMTDILYGATKVFKPTKTNLNDDDIQSLIKSAFVNQLVPASNKHIYVVITEKNVKVIHDKVDNAEFCKDVCAWHHYMTHTNMNIKYVFIGDTTKCPSSCSVLKSDGSNSPNKNFQADSLVNLIAYELIKTSSDPNRNGWYDINGNENGDKCIWKFGKVYQGTTLNSQGYWSQSIGEQKYLIQMNWGLKPVQGCKQM